MPEGPTVASGLPLNFRAEAMDRCLLTGACERSVGANFSAHFTTRSEQFLSGFENAKLENLPERNARFVALRRDRFDRVEIERPDFRDALIALENALKRLQIIREELVVAESLAKAEKTRFDLGDSTLLIVNLREQNAAEVALRLIGAEADYWNAKADYDAVMMKIPRS